MKGEVDDRNMLLKSSEVVFVISNDTDFEISPSRMRSSSVLICVGGGDNTVNPDELYQALKVYHY